jgi:hypothetical protein
MGVTIWRWSAGVALGCAAFAALLLPFPPTVPETWRSAAPPPLTAGLASLTQVAGEAHAAVRSYRAARALDRWSAARSDADTTLVRVDRGVPSTVAVKARTLILEQWAALSTPVSAQHAEVFVYVDSTPIPALDTSATTRRWLEPRRPVDVTYALPGATGGSQCVVLVRLRGVSDSYVNALRSQSLIGVCGFYAAFGLPGNGIRDWLGGSNYRFARRSDWSVARAPVTDASAVYGLHEVAARCLTGNRGACRGALRLDGPYVAQDPQSGQRLEWVLGETEPPNPTTTAFLGDADEQLLADAVRSLGAERFARFWRSRSAPDSAFLGAAGVAIEPWTQQWLTRVYGVVPARPSARVSDLLWLSIALALGLFVARRPRERVMA